MTTIERDEVTYGGWICTGRFVGTCRHCKIRVKVEGAPLPIYEKWDETCPQCGSRVKLTQVMGSRRADKRCDARCTNARGHDCECSCGGHNHGADR